MRATHLSQKITRKKAVIGVMGLGYVGLPLAVEFAKAGFSVYGFDVDRSRVRFLNSGRSYVQDIETSSLRTLIKSGNFKASCDPKILRRCDVIIICVPTPLNKLKEPDLSFVLGAVNIVRGNTRKGHLIILESTTYPGTTEETVLPEFEKSGWKVGQDFFLCFSPERIDPGNPLFPVHKIPKVVGGVTQTCAKLGALLYRTIIQQVAIVSSPRVAEFTKLLENTFRIVNIGLINELAMVSRNLRINIWEAIEAAKTKPFGFMPFYPGPGIGGHCIGIDPLYLSWKARLSGSEIRFVDLASRINAGMPGYVVQRAAYALNERKKTISRSKILVLGAAYKKDVNDVRESPAIEIITELKALGGKVEYHDPFVLKLRIGSQSLASIQLRSEALRRFDLVVIVTDHSNVDYELVLKQAKLILDTRNVLKRFSQGKNKVILL